MDYQKGLAKVEELASWCDRAIELQKRGLQYRKFTEWQTFDRQITEGLPLVEKIACAIDTRIAQRLRWLNEAYVARESTRRVA